MTTDSVANFSLRGTPDDVLGTALALCHWDCLLWHGQANSIARFPLDARVADIESVFAARNYDALGWGEFTGILTFDASKKTLTNAEIAEQMVPKQLEMIEHSARIAAVVMLHSACERSLWRFVRFGMVAHRSKAVEQISHRQVTVQQLSEIDQEELIDQKLEKWWCELERETILKKWDTLISLVGSPDKLRDGKWHFDRDMLLEFDDVRHNCVHHNGDILKLFDLDEFAKQLERAQLVWLVEVAMQLNVKMPAKTAFGLQD